MQITGMHWNYNKALISFEVNHLHMPNPGKVISCALFHQLLEYINLPSVIMTNLGKVPVYPLSHVKVMAMPALTYLGIPHFNASLVPESSVELFVNTLDQVGTPAAPKQWYSISVFFLSRPYQSFQKHKNRTLVGLSRIPFLSPLRDY
ncbi:hypothetical protein IV203_020609 [Nitzschia inconspicua]|uniref:Uncharacterized protein n=1 Tax=Nitzschia inconspicua TaxID=303405 RepID=A0A9K3KFK1_9STRA|nr:hypothetical protein IV203_020609 [Nitzschia inconspicua]